MRTGRDADRGEAELARGLNGDRLSGRATNVQIAVSQSWQLPLLPSQKRNKLS
jgi:hypothetical protein